MSIDVKCPQCGSLLEAPDNAAGKNVKCPDCGTRIPIPPADDAMQPTAQRPAAQRPAKPRDEAVAERPRASRGEEASEDEDDRPRRRRRDRDEDDDDDRPRRGRRDGYNDGGMSTLIPYKNGKALAAYYCGVFSLIPCVG